MERPTQELQLAQTKQKVIVVSYLTRRDILAITAADEKARDRLTHDLLIISVGAEKDKAKIYELVLDLPLVDYKVVDNYLMGLLPDDAEKKG